MNGTMVKTVGIKLKESQTVECICVCCTIAAAVPLNAKQPEDKGNVMKGSFNYASERKKKENPNDIHR